MNTQISVNNGYFGPVYHQRPQHNEVFQNYYQVGFNGNHKQGPAKMHKNGDEVLQNGRILPHHFPGAGSRNQLTNYSINSPILTKNGQNQMETIN